MTGQNRSQVLKITKKQQHCYWRVQHLDICISTWMRQRFSLENSQDNSLSIFYRGTCMLISNKLRYYYPFPSVFSNLNFFTDTCVYWDNYVYMTDIVYSYLLWKWTTNVTDIQTTTSQTKRFVVLMPVQCTCLWDTYF